jgi:acetyl-CoA C-acetyltransferase
VPDAAYIVDVIRTPVGRRGGALSKAHPADLAAHVMNSLFDRIDVDPAAVEDVIMGCCDNVGPQAGDIARTSWLAAGLPEHVPGVTLDRQCGSSQQAVHFAAQVVMSGTADITVAAGVQNMSMIPIASALTAAKPYGFEDPFSGSRGWTTRYGHTAISQYVAAETIATRWGISRDDMERFALESHRRATWAANEGRFRHEISPYGELTADEGPRADTSLEMMARLPPLSEGGRITAAVSSQLSDAASAMLVVSERALREHQLVPRACIRHMSALGEDPMLMLTAPIPATRHAIRRSGIALDDIDLIEINEAFASVVLARQREMGVDMSKVNVNGGAIALGHPIGATGIRLMATLLNELERTGRRFGLQVMCEGGGQANVTIIERLG